MLLKIIFILTIWGIAICQNTDDKFYCAVDVDEAGISMLEPKKTKDSTSAGFYSEYNKSTLILDFIIRDEDGSWKQYWSANGDNVIEELVLDQRWEKFVNSHDEPKSFQSMFENPNQTDFFSARVFDYHNLTFLKPANDTTRGQWHHFRVENKYELYECTENDANFKQIDYSNDSNMDPALKTICFRGDVLCKLQNYTYFHSNEANAIEIYKKEENCSESFLNATLSIYLRMCSGCSINISVTSNATTTFPLNGTGRWNREHLNMKNLTNCFTLSATPTPTHNGSWAVGNIGYLTNYSNCEKRYILVNSDNDSSIENFVCETAHNHKIKVTTSLLNMCSLKRMEEIQNTLLTNVSDSLTLVIISVVVVLIALIIIAAILVYFRIYKKRIPMKKTLQQYVSTSKSMLDEELELLNLPDAKSQSIDEESWPGIKRSNFTNYVNQSLNPNRHSDHLHTQFSDLPNGYLKDNSDGLKKENAQKNKFSKIVPYNDNRVRLKKNIDDKNHTTDYINASYVPGFNSPKEYIVTQNPLQNTVEDFWRMIWQENVTHVIMISSNNEEYFHYWPQTKKGVLFGGIEVSVCKEHHFEFYDQRTFVLRRYGEARDIDQLHYRSWANEETILSSHSFLQFTNHLLSIPHQTSPVVFHCLAGIGRSATIVLCDKALRAVATTGEVNLYAITKELRHSRVNMVQNLKQYQLAHLIIMETLDYKESALEIDEDFEGNFSRLFESNLMKKRWSQFLENKEWICEAITPYVQCKDYPGRNRHTDILPVQHSRVPLQNTHPDYINAMFVCDYTQRRNFIVAQQPLQTTLLDFWLMIIQNNVSTIINLHEIGFAGTAECCYFPSGEEVLKLQSNISLRLTEEQEHLSYDKLNITVRAQEENHSVTLISVKGWQKHRATPESADIMVDIWEAVKQPVKVNSPVLICCDDGIRACGLVACFLYMAQKMLSERKCDIVGAVRSVRRTHNSFTSIQQFMFLHNCAIAFYKNCMQQAT